MLRRNGCTNSNFARLCGIDNSVNYLKFLNKILLWSWYIDLTQPFSVCFLHKATSVSLLPGEVISACFF